MNRWFLPDAFSPDLDYNAPALKDLLTDTQHPETNSLGYQYQVSQYNRPKDYPSFYSSLAQNKQGLFVLAANNLNTFVYDCIISGTDNFNNIISSDFDGAKFKIHLKENAFNLQFIEDSLFVATTINNKVDLYSTKEPLLEGNFMSRISRADSDSAVTCLTQLLDKNRFIVGTSRGSLEAFECSNSALQPIFAFPNAHDSEVTGISVTPYSNQCFISCSSFECLLWDKRQIYPATAFVERKNIISSLTDVNWYGENYVILADSSGEIFLIDQRNPKNIIHQMTVNDDIERIVMNGDKFGVVSKVSNSAKVFEISKSLETSLLLEHSSPTLIYSLCWDKSGEKPDTCYVIGSNKYAKEIHVKSSL